MFERHIGEGREAALERLAVSNTDLVGVAILGAAIRVETEAVAHQDAVIVGTAQGAAERVGRDHAPEFLATDAGLFGRGERAGQATVGEDRQHAVFQEAEVLTEVVVAQDQLICGDASGRVMQDDLLAIVDGSNHRVFIQRDVLRQAVGQAFDQCRGLDQHCARGVQRLAVERGTDVVLQFVAFNQLDFFTQGFEAATVGIEHGDAFVLDGCLVFAGMAQVGVNDVVLLHQVAQDALATLVEVQDIPGVGLVADVVRCSDVMRHINQETGVTARGAEADLLCFNQDDFVLGEVQSELTCCRKASEATTNHDPRRLVITDQRRFWLTYAAGVEPARGRIVTRQRIDTHQ
ncbi:hypothetical protein D3C76_780950 [compost metagenome]